MFEKFHRTDEKGSLILLPEDRLRENAWGAVLLLPAALLWYGWSIQKETFWIVPVSSHSPLPCILSLLCAAPTGFRLTKNSSLQ